MSNLAQTDPASLLAIREGHVPADRGLGRLRSIRVGGALLDLFVREGKDVVACSHLILSIPLWIAMIVAVASPIIPLAMRSYARSSWAKPMALGSCLLQIWLSLVCEQVLRRARPYRGARASRAVEVPR